MAIVERERDAVLLKLTGNTCLIRAVDDVHYFGTAQAADIDFAVRGELRLIKNSVRGAYKPVKGIYQYL